METSTVSRAQQDIEELARHLKSDDGFEQSNYAVTSTWASKLGHPCGERFLFFLRTQWEQMAKKNWKGIGILGNLLHDWWKIHMMKKGYTVIQNEEPLSEELRRKFGIGGRIDGRIGKKKLFYYEFKSMDEHTYNKINSVLDMLESDRDYLRAYPAQLQTYLYDKNEEFGLFILCNKKTLEWKIIVVPLDLGYVETLLKKAEAVKKAYDDQVQENPFPRIPYGSTCKWCDFAHICLPDIINEGLSLEDNEHLEEIVKEIQSLKSIVSQHAKLDKEAKKIVKDVGKNFILGSSFMVQVQKKSGKKINLKLAPPEVIASLKAYEEETERVEIEFVPLAPDAPIFPAES